MRLRMLSVGLAIAMLGVGAACGGDSNKTADNASKIATQTPESMRPTAAAPTPTIDPGDFGPAPVLGGNITAISPTHASSISQAKSRTTNPQAPSGVCAKVTFDGLPENAQWFRVAFDGEEVTQKLVLIVASTTDAKGATKCYSPAEGFTVGRHSVAVAVQDPRNPSTPTRQLVSWKFDVTQ